MLSTVVCAGVFIGLLLASVVLWALFLRLGLRWARVPDVTTPRVVLATAMVAILQAAMNVLFLFVPPSSAGQSVVLGLVQIAATVIISCAVIGRVFKVRYLRAFQAWLPTLLATVTTFAFVLFVLRPYLYESFAASANSMAPTLVGPHWKGTCQKCGKPAYCSPRDERDVRANPMLLICDDFHVTEALNVDRTVYSADRFVVTKFLTPRRWDLIVFQFPEEPTSLYVKRLVGLPGERIHIEAGAVWVDGERQVMPDSLQGIEYLSELRGWHRAALWGSADRPALLGHDEYFVLGDFSAQSEDSRLWERGAPGHNPVAVPASHLRGVVTHTYWPPSRWRIHR